MTTALMVSSNTCGSSTTPIVSIGLPVYNDEKYLSKALDDLLSQTFPDFELIISDNGSTDRTGQICQQYAASDHRVYYFLQPANLGPHANFDFVLKKARGELFMWAAADDRWDKNFVAVLVEGLRRAKETATAFCPFAYIDEEDQPLSTAKTLYFSGASPFSRIAKFNIALDPGRDAFFYGLHRRELIQGAKMPIWWGINRDIAWNVAYPVLTYVLARGGYVQAAGTPLWFKRLHVNSAPRHSSGHQQSVPIYYLAFVVRKVNLFCECVRAVYRGTGSTRCATALSFVIGARCFGDCVVEAFRISSAVLRSVCRPRHKKSRLGVAPRTVC
jgi:glycosyltransferase involved in cell wall biosynthesis